VVIVSHKPYAIQILYAGFDGRVKLENEAFEIEHRHSEIERLIT